MWDSYIYFSLFIVLPYNWEWLTHKWLVATQTIGGQIPNISEWRVSGVYSICILWCSSWIYPDWEIDFELDFDRFWLLFLKNYKKNYLNSKVITQMLWFCFHTIVVCTKCPKIVDHFLCVNMCHPVQTESSVSRKI